MQPERRVAAAEIGTTARMAVPAADSTANWGAGAVTGEVASEMVTTGLGATSVKVAVVAVVAVVVPPPLRTQAVTAVREVSVASALVVAAVAAAVTIST